MKVKLGAKLQDLGRAQGSRGYLPEVAMELAIAAKAGQIEPDDALEAYVAYYKASSHLKTIDPYCNTVKANVSKLRQIIKCADPQLLERVTRTHRAMSRQGHVGALYPAMVNACRMQIQYGRKLTQNMLVRAIRTKR